VSVTWAEVWIRREKSQVGELEEKSRRPLPGAAAGTGSM